MAKTSSAAVSKALLGNFSDIVTAISAADPLKVAIELVSVSLTSQETLSKMLTVPATPLEKSTTLVMSVLDHVKIVPGKLETFMGTLHKSIDESSFKKILSSLRNEIGDDIGVFNPKMAEASSVDSPMEIYKSYLKSKYLEKKMPDYGKWPPSTSKKYVNLAVIEKVRLSPEEAKEKCKAFTYGDVGKIMGKGDIQLADIAAPNKDGVLPKFVLVEGAPGVGKSTFAWKACRKWAKGKILKDYKLVILVRLRDVSIRKATCLGDLIQYPRDPTVHQSVVEEITKTGGKGVLLLLEGYDELPASLREEGSLFRNVIKGDLFDEGTVMVTSRHWASESFLLPHYDTKRPVTKHIEILGFNRENIQDYLSLMLKEEPSLLHDIIRYLELSPHIHSMMYIPLNCAIILEVYKNKTPITTTMTELYSSLIRCLLLRHVYDLPEYKDKCAKLTDLSKLPECIKSHFECLAKLAYEGICKKDQQIIFTQDEIPSGLDTLGLMQSSMELHVDIGTEKSFNFLHLTIQEFLAAHHLLTYSLDEQVRLFCNNNFESVLLRFLAGLSPLALESAVSHHTHPLTISGQVTLENIHQLFEAIKIKVLQKSLTFCDIDIQYTIHPCHYYMLGSVIANACKSCCWDVTINYPRSENIHMFVSGIVSYKDEDLQSTLSLHINVNGYYDLLLELCSTPIILEDLELKLDDASDGIQIHDDIISTHLCPFFDKLSEGSPLLIKHLQFSGIGFNPEVSEKIEFFLMNTSSTTSLTIKYCFFGGTCDILPGKQALNNIEKLQCTYTREWEKQWGNNVFIEMLKLYKTLKEFHVSSQIGFTCSLAESLGANDTLKRIVLECEGFGRSFNFSLFNDGNHWRIEETSAKIIIENKTLTELSVRCHPQYNIADNSYTLARALCKNNTLEKLEITDLIFGVHRADAFATILRENTGLKELSLLGCIRKTSEWVKIFLTLSSSLSHNRTLLKLLITLPPALLEYDKVISACEKDSRLHCESSENLKSKYYDYDASI